MPNIIFTANIILQVCMVVIGFIGALQGRTNLLAFSLAGVLLMLSAIILKGLWDEAEN